jgi:membrane protease YdiL (CAAX protease family)
VSPARDPVPRPAAPAIEALFVLALTLPLAVWLRMPTIWFLVPFVLITVTRRPYEEYGFTLRGAGSPRFHLAVSAAVLGTYAVLHYAFARSVLGRSFQPTLAPDFFRLLFLQLLVIGLSEEVFFRGYLQTRLDQTFGRPFRFLGASWGAGLPLAALLFGLCHVIDGDLTRLRVVFFGLFAGWLRARCETIAVPAAYHGLSNVLYDFMLRSMR